MALSHAAVFKALTACFEHSNFFKVIDLELRVPPLLRTPLIATQLRAATSIQKERDQVTSPTTSADQSP